jgi:hypothetical protein
MICEIIGKPGEPGSGAGADAFEPGIGYVCEKAGAILLRNLTGEDWRDAGPEMRLTSELSKKVRKPYYHLVLSWHELEKPSDEQMLEAMTQMLEALGLEEYQAVIGTHHDREHQHVHAVVNTVHPTSGKAWSKSNDQQKAELACRQIELDHGWTADRGRFDVAVDEVNGRQIARLVPKPDEHWEDKRAAREKGRRSKTAGQVKSEKRTGVPVLDATLPVPLREKFATVVDAASDWQELHLALGRLGLRYEAFGSGARVAIIGAPPGGAGFAKASSLGARFSIKRMEARLGRYQQPTSEYCNDLKPIHTPQASLQGWPAPDMEKSTRASQFKLTLLARLYVGIHLHPDIVEAIRFVDLADHPPQISFQDGSTVVDHGGELSTSASTDATRATMIAMAIAKGWTRVQPTGDAAFIREIAIAAAKSGLEVTGVPPEVQVLSDEHLAQFQKQQRRIDLEACEAEIAHLSASADRDISISENAEARAASVAEKAVVTAAAQAASDAIGPGRSVAQQRARLAIRDEEAENLARLPDARKAPAPQVAPDVDRHDRQAARKTHAKLRENDRHELEELKRLDIGTVAFAYGWADVSQSHPDSSDRIGKAFRIYTRDKDTIKASLKDGKWLWTSNKTGKAGSVIDLWLADHPAASLGDARAALRELAGLAAPNPGPKPASAPMHRDDEKKRDHTFARNRWKEAKHITAQRSYAEKRGISRETLARFPEELRVGAFGGVYFAHRNLETGDIQGFEPRWEDENGEKNTARFAKGGRKTVNVLGAPARATRMAVVESGLDALALAEFEDRDDTLYVSTGGGFGPLTGAALLRLAQGRTVVSAFDNDRGGETLHLRLLGVLPEAKRLAPPSQVQGQDGVCKDWLDVLNALKTDVLSARAGPSPRQSTAVSQGVPATPFPTGLDDPQPE